MTKTTTTNETTKTMTSLTVGVYCLAIAFGATQPVALGILGASVVAGLVIGWRA